MPWPRHQERCTCCGQVLPLEAAHLSGITLTGWQARVAELVRLAGPEGAASDWLVEKLYGDDPGGGPDHAPLALRTGIFHLNLKLRPHGFEVAAAGWGHGNPGRYRLREYTPGSQQARKT